MRNLTSLFLLAITGSAAYYFLKGKKESLENLIIKPIDIAIDSKKSRQLFFQKLFYNIKLKITNPSGFAVKILSIDLDFIVNNEIIAEIQKQSAIIIKPNETKVITIESSIATLGIIQQIISMITNKEGIDVAIKGDVQTDLGNINIAYAKKL